jgi:hypothetical protein
VRVESAFLALIPAAACGFFVTPRGCGAETRQGSLSLPLGFSIALYAGGVAGARSLAVGARGTVLVGHQADALRSSGLETFASGVRNSVDFDWDPGYRRALVRRQRPRPARRVLQFGGSYAEHEVTDHAYDLWRRGHPGERVPPHFVTAHAIDPVAHLEMQAGLQPFVDSAISKTINVPPGKWGDPAIERARHADKIERVI